MCIVYSINTNTVWLSSRKRIDYSPLWIVFIKSWNFNTHRTYDNCVDLVLAMVLIMVIITTKNRLKFKNDQINTHRKMIINSKFFSNHIFAESWDFNFWGCTCDKPIYYTMHEIMVITTKTSTNEKSEPKIWAMRR